jgi:hypothetical protein
MIRFTFAAAFFIFVIVLLQIPSVYSASRFMEQIRIEHALCSQFWSEHHANAILERMMDFDDAATLGSSASSTNNGAKANGVDSVASHQGALVSMRFIRNPYFRSINAMFTLVAYRASSLLEWQPILLSVCVLLLIDGFATRVIKSKEFRQHNPQSYALFSCMTIVGICGTWIAFMLPYTLSPMFAPTLQITSTLFANRAISNYQYRG